MRRSFFDKMIITYIFIAITSFLLMLFFMNSAIETVLIGERKSNLNTQATFVTMQCIRPYIKGDITKEVLNNELNNLTTLLDTTVWYCDTNGHIIATSDSHYDTNFNIFTYITKNDMMDFYSVRGTFNNIFSADILTISIPINESKESRGYIILHSNISSLGDIKNDLLNVSYLAFFTVVLFSFLFLYQFMRKIIIPLDQINNTAKEYADGNFESHLNITRHDEIGSLANSLDNMADELSKLDEYRRDFISNVSHDFRSPLTSIKGYVEAILDGTIPPSKQERYLTVVLTETKRLNKLTDGLLTLTDFDKFGPIIKRQNFDINEIIREIMATFEGACNTKHISITPFFQEKNNVVWADKSKIQQVLYNLIDNAIKFSPENSKINVSVFSQNGKYSISVKDEGVGIHESEQKKIWERFYKADLSRGKDKQGTGLGLSIVKEIIKAHDEEISLISEENNGCEFIFTLPKAH